MAPRVMLLLLLLPCATPGSAENSSLPAGPRNYTSGGLPDTGSALLRLFYVVTGLCGLISLYFLIRAFRCVTGSNQRLVSHPRGGWPGGHVTQASSLVFIPDSEVSWRGSSCPSAEVSGVQKTMQELQKSFPGRGMKFLSSMHKALGGEHAWHLGTWKVEAGGSLNSCKKLTQKKKPFFLFLWLPVV